MRFQIDVISPYVVVKNIQAHYINYLTNAKKITKETKDLFVEFFFNVDFFYPFYTDSTFASSKFGNYLKI